MTTLYFEASDEDDLLIRPIYHCKQSRIEVHIRIAFTAYCVYKELHAILGKCDSQQSAVKEWRNSN